MRKRSSSSAKISVRTSAASSRSEKPPRQKPATKTRRESPAKSADLDRLRSRLAAQLHDLQNALWPASVEVELSLSDGNCSPTMLEMLQRLGRSIEEAMTISSQMSKTLDQPAVE